MRRTVDHGLDVTKDRSHSELWKMSLAGKTTQSQPHHFISDFANCCHKSGKIITRFLFGDSGVTNWKITLYLGDADCQESVSTVKERFKTLNTLSVGGIQQQQNTKPQGYGSEEKFSQTEISPCMCPRKVSNDCCSMLRIIAQDQIKILWASNKMYARHNFIK